MLQEVHLLYLTSAADMEPGAATSRPSIGSVHPGPSGEHNVAVWAVSGGGQSKHDDTARSWTPLALFVAPSPDWIPGFRVDARHHAVDRDHDRSHTTVGSTRTRRGQPVARRRAPRWRVHGTGRLAERAANPLGRGARAHSRPSGHLRPEVGSGPRQSGRPYRRSC